MTYIDRQIHENLVIDQPTCFNKGNTVQVIVEDTEKVSTECKQIILEHNIKHASTWLLEKDLLLQYERQLCPADEGVLSRGRIILVNPGVSNIGKEQRYLHYYIVLGEFKETFIGVPITNMARNKQNGSYYLRNVFEVELIDPTYNKPFTEYRCSKPSVADVRNISGLDKRRIVRNHLYVDKKYVPNAYLNSISEKIRETLAIIITE